MPIRKIAGLDVGDFVEANVEHGKITLTPQSFVDKRIAAGMADYKAGRYHEFDSMEKAIAFLAKHSRKPSRSNKRRRE